MLTSCAISTITYNTIKFLDDTLTGLIEKGKISFYCYIFHKAEDDELKDHIHLFIIPCSRIDTFALEGVLKEVDPHNDLPLGCIPFVHSKWEDWFLYGLHDDLYLRIKGKPPRKFHYSKSDMHCSNETYLDQRFLVSS